MCPQRVVHSFRLCNRSAELQVSVLHLKSARYVYADGSAYKGPWSADSMDGELHPLGGEAGAVTDHP